MKATTTLLPGLAVAVATMLAGCSSPSLDQYASVRAELDAETVTIHMPLDEYALDGREGYEVAHANALLIAGCMAQAGLDYPRADENWDTKPVREDRRYGLWSLEAAEAYGYEYPRDARALEIDEMELTFKDDWWAAWDRCLSSVEQFPKMTIGNAQAPSPVDRGVQEANNQARGTAEYAEEWQVWADCVSAAGLTPASDKTVLVPELPSSPQERVRIAVLDVQCKQEHNTIQTIADIEAQYQAAYIDAHESELVEFRDQAEDVLRQAREVVATYG